MARVEDKPATQSDLPGKRIGVIAGLVAISCCVGPAVLALFGLVSAANAYLWADRLYGGYAWWFRAAGLLVAVGLTARTLRRRNQCSIAGARGNRRALAVMATTAVLTYAVLYGVTTALGHLAT